MEWVEVWCGLSGEVWGLCGGADEVWVSSLGREGVRGKVWAVCCVGVGGLNGCWVGREKFGVDGGKRDG